MEIDTTNQGLPPGAQQTKTVTVRDAAMLLNWSIWRVYKLDRTAGPLQFMVERGRIKIDRASIDAYLARIQADRRIAGTNQIITAPEIVVHGQARVENSDERSDSITRVDQSYQDDRPAGRSGQRDLLGPATRPAFSIAFVGWTVLE
jgi:hypothetical protein